VGVGVGIRTFIGAIGVGSVLIRGRYILAMGTVFVDDGAVFADPTETPATDCFGRIAELLNCSEGRAIKNEIPSIIRIKDNQANSAERRSMRLRTEVRNRFILDLVGIRFNG
jgi:hypothetical protein